jgi:cobalamin-dependent methionine synthase I
MTFATLEIQSENKKFKVNLKARYTQKGSIVIATAKGDIIDILPDGTVELITTPSVQYTQKSK